MIRVLLILLLAGSVRAADIADFAIVTEGHYQVLAQSGVQRGREVSAFMNAMLQQYSRYFSNWSAKDGARVVVFDNREDFRAYSADAIGMTHPGLTGYCHLKMDEAGNTFFELVTFEDPGLWGVLAHEGFHQFIGYELGLEIPVWLNEGLAQYFETVTFKNGRMVTGAVDPNRLGAAQALIRARQMPALEDILGMERRTFYASANTMYPASWALVYYLMTRDGRTYQNSSFRRYLLDLKYSPNDVASFRRRFGRDSAAWQSDFANYILKLTVPAEK